MAKQKEIIKLNVTIGDITFYKSKDGYLAREKDGVPADRIANDPALNYWRVLISTSMANWVPPCMHLLQQPLTG